MTGPDGPIVARLGTLAADVVVDAPWPRADVAATRRTLIAAAQRPVRSLVYVSSATVYGAWADNPVPLTEDAPLRPNPAIGDAVAHAEVERLVAEWADDHPATKVAVLRPAVVLGPGVDTWLSRALTVSARLRSDSTDPARQFVHVEDVVGAVRLVVANGLDGVFNVAAEGSVASDVVRRLSAGRLSVPVPGPIAAVAMRWSFGLGLSELSPAVAPLIEYPWVVAIDRLRAAGWAPQYTNEEAVVAGRPGSWWREMSPGRRQQVALGGSAAVLAGGAAAIAGAVAAHRRRPD
ncbi:MAG: NAD-dependent epimerase/dehydratase family protein [Acidimicrobiales bacterium]